MNLVNAQNFVFFVSLIVLSISIIAIFFRAVIGPKVTDRIICVNMIGTKVIIMICIISGVLKENFIIDVALLYALLNFVSMVVLTYAYQYTYFKNKKKLAARRKK